MEQLIEQNPESKPLDRILGEFQPFRLGKAKTKKNYKEKEVAYEIQLINNFHEPITDM